MLQAGGGEHGGQGQSHVIMPPAARKARQPQSTSAARWKRRPGWGQGEPPLQPLPCTLPSPHALWRRTRERHVADAAAIGPPPRHLQLINNLHRPHLWVGEWVGGVGGRVSGWFGIGSAMKETSAPPPPHHHTHNNWPHLGSPADSAGRQRRTQRVPGRQARLKRPRDCRQGWGQSQAGRHALAGSAGSPAWREASCVHRPTPRQQPPSHSHGAAGCASGANCPTPTPSQAP